MSETDRQPWLKRFVVGGIGLLTFIALYYPLFLRPSSAGIIDADYFNSWQLAVNDTLRQGALLHWMPYMCGGQPGLGNPQSGGVSPFNLLGLFLSPVLQFKIELLFNALIGLTGFIWIAERLQAARSTALIGFVIWAGNGFVATRILHGQTAYFPFLVVPLLVAALIAEALRRDDGFLPSRFTLMGAVFSLILILYQDGFHVLIYISPLLAILVIGWGVGTKRWSPMVLLLLSSLFALALAMPRIWPALAFMSETPRVVSHLESISPPEVLWSLLDADLLGFYHDVRIKGESHRYGFVGYIGIVALALSLTYFLRRRRSRSRLPRWPWIVSIGAGLVLMMGAWTPWAPWTLLRDLPLLSMVRAPFKFGSSVALSIALCSMFAVIQISRDVRSIYARRDGDLMISPELLISTAATIALFTSYAAALWPIERVAYQPLPEVFEAIDHHQPFRQVLHNPFDMYRAVASNTGLVNCYEPTSRSSHVPYGAPLAVLKSGEGRVEASLRPNRIEISCTTPVDDEVIVYQNYDPLWTVTGTSLTVERHPTGVMRIQVPAGSQQFAVLYRPIYFHRGLVIATLALVCIAIGFWWRRRRDQDV